MFKVLFKKENQLKSLIFEYMQTLKLSQESFLNALQACLLNGVLCENFNFYIKQTHKHESRADDIHDEINNLMYSKTLIPESRGDILGLLEALDTIPDLFEHILYMIQTQRLTIPVAFVPKTKELVAVSLECCELVALQVEALLQHPDKIREHMAVIDTKESLCDHIERHIIADIFADTIDPHAKLQLKELIEAIGDISDRADQVSKRINIISLKRRV
jgi:predicted phosphate transport protein (TIGR00153 family)